MSNPISFCDSCYPTSFPECENLTFVAGLTPSTNYTAIVTNHFGQKYTQDVTTDTGGAFELDYTLFPEGFFNPYSGFFTLEVQTVAGIPATMTIMYSTYDCVSFDIYQLNDAN